MLTRPLTRPIVQPITRALTAAGSGSPDPTLRITGTPPAGYFGVAYSWTPSIAGGTAPYVVTVTTGTLPSWATLDAPTGNISGTPDALTSINVTLTVTDDVLDTDTLPITATISATVPDAPTIGSASGGDTEADVAFTAPSNDGGDTITGYTATSSPGSITGTGASSPITVTGLTNDTAYTFAVKATNGIGDSAASAASNSVTPTAAGGTVSIVYGPTADTGALTGAVTFAGTPADGTLIVLEAYIDNATDTIVSPAGTWNTAASINQGGARPAVMFWKFASGESGATYTMTRVGIGSIRSLGYVLSGVHATPIGNTDTNATASGTGESFLMGDTGIDVSAGSLVLAFRGCSQVVTSPSFDNGFTGTTPSTSTQACAAHRSYASADTAQNTTASWTTAAGHRRGILVEIKAA